MGMFVFILEGMGGGGWPSFRAHAALASFHFRDTGVFGEHNVYCGLRREVRVK